MQHPISLAVPSGMEAGEGERVAVRIYSREPVRAKIVDDPLPGYDVDRADLDAALSRADAGVRIAASRHGVELTTDRLGQLVEGIGAGDGGDLTVVFGSPARGLPAILGVDAESVGPTDIDEAVTGSESDTRFDLWLNTIPDQGSEVVQTEEAMVATLACLTLTE
jgi:predicted SPOUT superfamily RNA methylase MTH1